MLRTGQDSSFFENDSQSGLPRSGNSLKSPVLRPYPQLLNQTLWEYGSVLCHLQVPRVILVQAQA